jgi:hypothetical protein
MVKGDTSLEEAFDPDISHTPSQELPGLVRRGDIERRSVPEVPLELPQLSRQKTERGQGQLGTRESNHSCEPSKGYAWFVLATSGFRYNALAPLSV